MEKKNMHVTEEQFNRLVRIERIAGLARRSKGLNAEFERFLDGLDRRVGSGSESEPERTRWSLYRYKEGNAGKITGFVKEPFKADAEKDNYLVSSLCRDGMHAPAIDIDLDTDMVPAGMGQSITIYRGGPESAYRKLIDACVASGITSQSSAAALTKDHRVWQGSIATTLYSEVPTRLVPSSTKKHFHLYFDIAMPWASYKELLQAFAASNLYGKPELKLALERKMTLLIDPDMSKKSVAARVSKPKRSQNDHTPYRWGY